jgi:hypothetical protein
MPAAPEAKHTEPDIRQLVQQGNDLRQKAEAGADFEGKQQWLGMPPTLPAPIARLTGCLQDRVDAQPETLINALQLVAFFAQGCRSKEDWRALSAGPYGEELVRQAWLLYESTPSSDETWHRNTCAVLAAFRHEHAYGSGKEGLDRLQHLIARQDRENIALGLMTCAGLLWTTAGAASDVAAVMPLEAVESRLFIADTLLCELAIWAWASILRERKSPPGTSPRNLDRLAALWLGSFPVAAYALCQHLGMPRDAWSPQLTEVQIGQVRAAASAPGKDPDTQTGLRAALMVAFHARNVWTDEDLASLLQASGKQPGMYIRGPQEDRRRLIRTLEQLSED